MVNCIDTGSGEVVLFLHGWGAPAALYKPVLDHLAKRFRVIAPDLPGFGGTFEPDRPWSTDDYVDFAQSLLKELGIERCTLIGHSHGGRMILNWLTRAEQPIAVKRAVLCGSTGLKPPRGANYYIKVYTYKAVKALLKPFPNVLARYTGNAGSADYRAASPVMRATLSKVVNDDYSALMPNIKLPVLLVWGDGDTASPLSNGQRMEKLIPDAGLVTLTGGTHFAILEQVNIFLRVLDVFIKD